MQSDGATLREHWQVIERQTGKRPDALNTPECPDVLTHVWEWFQKMHRRRRVGFNGPEAIDDTAIETWARLRRVRITPFEVEAIQALDEAYFVHLAEMRKTETGNKTA